MTDRNAVRAGVIVLAAGFLAIPASMAHDTWIDFPDRFPFHDQDRFNDAFDDRFDDDFPFGDRHPDQVQPQGTGPGTDAPERRAWTWEDQNTPASLERSADVSVTAHSVTDATGQTVTVTERCRTVTVNGQSDTDCVRERSTTP